MKGIYLLEPDEDEGVGENNDHVKISLHALTCIRTGQTMRLHVEIGGKKLVALVDSGSTHTFLAETVAQRLGLSRTPRPGMSVTVANGDRMTSSGICTNARIVIDQEKFFTDYYVIPLDRFVVVLGVQWVRTLGHVL